MLIRFAVDGDRIVSNNNAANKSHQKWVDKYSKYDIKTVSTEDNRFCCMHICKVENNEIVIDEEKIAAEVKENGRRNFKAQRDLALAGNTVTLDGVGTFQVRPVDVANFQQGISLGVVEWVLEDNTVATVTCEQLQQVLAEGLIKGKQIWESYMANLKTL